MFSQAIQLAFDSVIWILKIKRDFQLDREDHYCYLFLSYQGPTEEDHASDVGKNCKQQPGNLSDLSKLSLINGAINRMSKMELVTQLRNLKLKANGNKAVTTKRLKEFYKKQRMPSPMMSIQPSTSKARHQVFRYICVIDFEATCEETNKNYPHEIIEFPAILIDIETREVVGIIL